MLVAMDKTFALVLCSVLLLTAEIQGKRERYRIDSEVCLSHKTQIDNLGKLCRRCVLGMHQWQKAKEWLCCDAAHRFGSLCLYCDIQDGQLECKVQAGMDFCPGLALY